jgi:hypothetical protein
MLLVVDLVSLAGVRQACFITDHTPPAHDLDKVWGSYTIGGHRRLVVDALNVRK